MANKLIQLTDGADNVFPQMETRNGTITFPSGNTDLVFCKRSGNVVYFSARITNMNVPYGQPLLIFPEGFRPVEYIYMDLGCQAVIGENLYSSGLFGLTIYGELKQEIYAGTTTQLTVGGMFII